MSNYTTNQELARDYKRLADARPVERTEFYLWVARIAQRVSAFEVNIPQYFNEHGNLTGLKIPGVEKKVMPYLSALLIDGFDEAKKKQDKRVEAKASRLQWEDIPGEFGAVIYDEDWRPRSPEW